MCCAEGAQPRRGPWAGIPRQLPPRSSSLELYCIVATPRPSFFHPQLHSLPPPHDTLPDQSFRCCLCVLPQPAVLALPGLLPSGQAELALASAACRTNSLNARRLQLQRFATRGRDQKNEARVAVSKGEAKRRCEAEQGQAGAESSGEWDRTRGSGAKADVAPAGIGWCTQRSSSIAAGCCCCCCRLPAAAAAAAALPPCAACQASTASSMVPAMCPRMSLVISNASPTPCSSHSSSSVRRSGSGRRQQQLGLPRTGSPNPSCSNQVTALHCWRGPESTVWRYLQHSPALL